MFTPSSNSFSSPWVVRLVVFSIWLAYASGMADSQIRELRAETEHMFFHGFDNYMRLAFPEDELRPVSCRPLTRGPEFIANNNLNDVLGNYSLTLVDSLSTLAILASVDSSNENERKAWDSFQNGVKDFVGFYGDGSHGPSGQGSRARGFDIDSKVQVFETVIRGLGGLLSAHQFAVGDLPVRGYSPPENEAEFARLWEKPQDGRTGIRWPNGFIYDGQLLRLAMDLGTRILPAFFTPTGIPYPRVNLRHGVPFYAKSPLNQQGTPPEEVLDRNGTSRKRDTENCSAGAGSLTLEFIVLSRLTGDGRFEEMAKRAFWSVWARRSDIGLIGGGIDVESGVWFDSYTGIGASVDSFFEYAFKSHILLSGGNIPEFNRSAPLSRFDDYYAPLPPEAHVPDSFLKTWQESAKAIKDHLYQGSGYQYPHYAQADIFTGETRAFWMDSLSAFYPGLLTLAGDIPSAAEAHLLHTALWTRFSALPERWNAATGYIEGGLGWWPGRPEFIESTYYLYRATEDPWYLHVGEMVLRDIKRRCWTKCGWAGLQDVVKGEQNDRMESFFLGETAKYLYLLFNPSHPLNHLDAPFVFSTEGHPLITPRNARQGPERKSTPKRPVNTTVDYCSPIATKNPFGISSTAGRPDVFHAASLAQLHLRPKTINMGSPIVPSGGTTQSDIHSPSNYTYFPWTLPPNLVPRDAKSARMSVRPTIHLSFPSVASEGSSGPLLERFRRGILAKSLGGIRLGLVREVIITKDSDERRGAFRVQVINNLPLGFDEKLYIRRESISVLDPSDPNFALVADKVMLSVLMDLQADEGHRNSPSKQIVRVTADNDEAVMPSTSHDEGQDSQSRKSPFSSFVDQVASLLREEIPKGQSAPERISLPAIAAAGKGSAPLPKGGNVHGASSSPNFVKNLDGEHRNKLPWSDIYLAQDLCDQELPPSVPSTHQVIIVKRGRCQFAQKLRNIPQFTHSNSSLRLVIMVSYGDDDGKPTTSYQSEFASASGSPSFAEEDVDESTLIRPLLDEPQTVAGGGRRSQPISMVLVGGGDKTYDYFKRATRVGIRRRYKIQSQGFPISNLVLV